MKTSQKNWFVSAAIILVAIIFLAGTTGCSKNNGPTILSGNQYNIVCQLSTSNGFDAFFKVTVKGITKEVGVVLIGPTKKPVIRYIGSLEMAANCRTIELPIYDLSPGTRTVMVKTLNPEKIEWKKDFDLTQSKPRIKEIALNFEAFRDYTGEYAGSQLKDIGVIIQPEENLENDLPIDFTGISITVDQIVVDGKKVNISTSNVRATCGKGLRYGFKFPTSCTLVGEKGGYGHITTPIVFKSGESYKVKGLLSYGKSHESIPFEKEFTIPPYGNGNLLALGK